jgi:hypothetical protein
MSLPSVVIFFKDEKEVKREFTNCGWFCNTESVINGIKRTLMMCGDFEWDVAKAYNMTFKKEEIFS